MRILFDHQVFSWQSYGGVSRYFVEQMRGLMAQGHEARLPDGFYAENVYLRQMPGFQRKSLTSFAFKGKKMLQNLLGRRASRRAVRDDHPDVFHPTYFDPYFLPTVQQQKTPFVLTVHDMIHEIYGHGSQNLFSLDRNVVKNKRLLAEKADAVIAVSENTRRDLLRFCPDIDASKVFVAHHGNALLRPPGATHAVQGNYLLFVGQRKAYKNFLWMAAELAGLLHSEKDLQLWCVGGSDFDANENEQLARLGIASKVLYKKVGSDDALADIYAGARCFIFPSQYEGFGIPVLEAFGCGCPAVLNRCSSLPEVGGDAAIYFDEKAPGSLETAVRNVLYDTALRKEVIQRGYERAAAFTWEKSVARHLEVYQSLQK
jgi:glycosyltransferase involved in cell wall biosynthesis